MKNLFFLSLAVTMLFSCKPDENQIEGTFHIRAVEALAHPTSSYNYDEAPGIADADVVVYPTKQDFLLNTNPITQGKTNADGWFEFKKDIPNGQTYFYYKVSKDTLNNLRTWEHPNYYGTGGKDDKQWVYYYATLSTTPTRLQLNILENGSPVDNAEVQLFWSEDDYNNNVTPMHSTLPNNYGNTFTNHTFVQYTDENGTVVFDNLEPRQYWFKIRRYTKHYTSTPYTTNGKLEDNPDLTTVLTVNVE